MREKLKIDELVAATNLILNKLIPEHSLYPPGKYDQNQPHFSEVLKELEKQLGQPFDELPIVIQEHAVLRRSRQIVASLMTNELWSKRIKDAGVHTPPTNWEDWQKLPITDRETLLEFYGGYGQRPGLVKPYNQGGFQITTSGGTSSGTPIETIYTKSELQYSYNLAGKFIGKNIVEPLMEEAGASVPYLLFSILSDSGMWSTGTLIGSIMSEIPNTNYIPAGPLNEKALSHLLKMEGGKGTVGLPRELYALANEAGNMSPEDRAQLFMALYGGGVLLNHKRDSFKKVFPNAQMLSFYSSTQSLAMALQLRENDPTLRAVPGMHLLEIVDPETGLWVNPGEPGDLVVTRLQADGAPIIRMRIGDLVSLTSPDKDDILQAQHLEFGGRSGDIIHIGESHYSAQRLYQSIYHQLQETGFDLGTNADEVQFVIDQSNAVLELRIEISNDGLRSELNNQISAGMKRDMMIAGLKQSIPQMDDDQAHYNMLDNTEWKLLITGVTKEQIFVSQRNKTPLVRTVG